MKQIELRADGAGSIELVCERSVERDPLPRVRSFVGGDEFGLLVDDLEPHELVTLYVEA